MTNTRPLYFNDDGAGGIKEYSYEPPLAGASLDYASGSLKIPLTSLKRTLKKPVYEDVAVYPGMPKQTVCTAYEDVEAFAVAPQTVRVTRPAAGTLQTSRESLKNYRPEYRFRVFAQYGGNTYAVRNTWVFAVNNERVFERGGKLYRDWNMGKGAGTECGALDTDGNVVLHWDAPVKTVSILSGVIQYGSLPAVVSFHGRVDAAPIRPQSLSFRALSPAGDELVGTTDAAGKVQGDFSGFVDYASGYYFISSAKIEKATADLKIDWSFTIKISEEETQKIIPFRAETLRWNAVSVADIPLDEDVLGISSTRLPQDGRVPVFRTGDMVVISNRKKEDIGRVFTAGQTVQLSRGDVDRVCVNDVTGKAVDASLYAVDLAAGTITFNNDLDLSPYQMPLTAHTVQEEANRLMNTHITGKLVLQFPVSRDYAAGETFISSAVIGADGGTLQVRATEPFAQRSFTNNWKDEIQGDPVLARLNVKDFPIDLTDDGAITGRWMLHFTSASGFSLYEENLGLVAYSDTVSDLAPVNPASGKPFFTLRAAAFGGGWQTGNVIRFNTEGTQVPVWVCRAVTPSAEKQTHKDGFMMCLRGNTIEDEGKS